MPAERHDVLSNRIPCSSEWGFYHFQFFIMEKTTLYPVTFTADQLQAFMACERTKNAATYEKAEAYAHRWRIAEAKNRRLERENRKLREKHSLVRSIRRLVNWASQPSKKEKEFRYPGFEMELVVFGLLVVVGSANALVHLL